MSSAWARACRAHPRSRSSDLEDTNAVDAPSPGMRDACARFDASSHRGHSARSAAPERRCSRARATRSNATRSRPTPASASSPRSPPPRPAAHHRSSTSPPTHTPGSSVRRHAARQARRRTRVSSPGGARSMSATAIDTPAAVPDHAGLTGSDREALGLAYVRSSHGRGRISPTARLLAFSRRARGAIRGRSPWPRCRRRGGGAGYI
jgi:hypothetical protein